MTARFDASAIDQRIVMYGKTWAEFEAQVALRGEERRRPKLAFLDGAMELMSPSHGHEKTSFTIGQILVLYCVEVGIEIRGTGAWRIGSGTDQAGVEPDESFILGPDSNVSKPTLVIEVVWTHGGIDKLEIYRRLQISEVWFWDRGDITIHRLVAGAYEPALQSTLVPGIDLALVCELAAADLSVNELVTRIRAFVAQRK